MKNKVVVRYWMGELTKEERAKVPFVTEDDRNKAEKFLFERDKTEHTVSAYFKRKYIGDWGENEYGKPIALSGGGHFNLSHSEGAVVFALSERNEVGVDIEKIRKVGEDLAEYVASVEEREIVKSEKGFFEIWTAKESLAKASGKGIAERIEKIPALPLSGKKNYNGETYTSKAFFIGEYILSVTVKTEEEIEVEISEEMLK